LWHYNPEDEPTMFLLTIDIDIRLHNDPVTNPEYYNLPVTGWFRQLHTEEHILYSSLNIFRALKSRTKSWAAHEARMGVMKNTCTIIEDWIRIDFSNRLL
jgi:hypothetical protein